MTHVAYRILYNFDSQRTKLKLQKIIRAEVNLATWLSARRFQIDWIDEMHTFAAVSCPLRNETFSCIFEIMRKHIFQALGYSKLQSLTMSLEHFVPYIWNHISITWPFHFDHFVSFQFAQIFARIGRCINGDIPRK